MQWRHEGDLLVLLPHRLDHMPVAMPDADHENAADPVDVTLPLDIVYIDTLAPLNHQRLLAKRLHLPQVKNQVAAGFVEPGGS